MEVVIATSLIAHFGVLAVDRYIAKLEASAVGDVPHATDEQQTISSSQPQGNESATKNESAVTKPEEGSIEFLEMRLKELRNQAKRLNAPDTLVQYARVTREANKVEKDVNEKKGT